MQNALMEANGLNATVLLFRDSVRIRSAGVRSFLSGASKVEKDILVSQIVGVQFKKAGVLANGYIVFELKDRHEKVGKDAKQDVDEVVVSFKPGQQKQFEALREMLVTNLTSGGANQAPSPAATDLDQLAKLASLRDRGIITEQEFNLKKKQILGL